MTYDDCNVTEETAIPPLPPVSPTSDTEDYPFPPLPLLEPVSEPTTEPIECLTNENVQMEECQEEQLVMEPAITEEVVGDSFEPIHRIYKQSLHTLKVSVNN